MKKRIILSFIIFSLLITYIFPIVSFGTYNNYISLGDSIPSGYALENPDAEVYPEKLRQKLNISSDNFNNLAISEDSTSHFYNALQTSEYTNAITNADLLTITIGSNEILEIVREAVSNATGIGVEERDFYEKTLSYFNNASLFAKLQMLLDLYEYFTTEDIKGKVDTKINKYEEYWEKSINYIKQINPDVTIVATEFYNPYYEITLLNYDFGGWCDEIIQRMNIILHNYSNSETDYKIAKIYSTFNTTNPRLTNVSMSLTNFNIDPHPTALGHEIISLKILEALSTDTNQNKKDISTLSITDIEDQEYTGNAIKPEIIIKDANTVLVENKDYIIIYYNNINVGKASAIITGIGNYTGKTTKTFNIKNSNIKDISTCQINSLDYQSYLGINLEPDVVILDGTTILTKNTDYRLTYSNNVNVGIATITITGIGNYTGTTTTNFIIAPMDINTTTILDIPDQLYTGSEITPNVIVFYGATKLVEGTDYTLNCNNNIDIGTATIDINGIGNYTGTVTKQFNIVNTITSELTEISQATISGISDKTYSGNPITPEISITLGEYTLARNVDYKAFYSDNINIGTGIITIVGIGDYTGTLETTFKIVPKNIENIGLSDIPNQTYTGKSIEPEIILTDNLTKLYKNKDFTVTYSDNTNVGVATVEINGIGNYTGTLFKTFNIVEPDTEPEPTPTPEPVPDEKDEQPDDNPPLQNIPGNTIDNTTSNNTLPHAGSTLKIFVLIIFLACLSRIFYILYKRWF